MPRVEPDSNDLVVWKLDESAAPFRNSGSLGVSSTTDLTITNLINTERNGIVGKCIDIPGGENAAQRNNVRGASTFEPQPPITLSCWVLMRSYINTGGDNNGQILRKALTNLNWGDPFSACGFALLGFGDGTWATTITTTNNSLVVSSFGSKLPLGIWAHIGLTYDGSELKSYMNGNLLQTQSATGSLNYGSHGDWFTGGIPAGGANKQEPCIMIQDIRVANVIRPLEYFKNIHRVAYLGLQNISQFTRYYKLRAFDSSCDPPTPITWIDTEISLDNAPSPPCSGPLSDLEVMDTWIV